MWSILTGHPLQSKIASFVIAAILLLSLIWVVKDGVAVPAILFSIISKSSSPQNLESDLIISSHGSTVATMARPTFTLLHSFRRRCRDGLQLSTDHSKCVDRAESCAEKLLTEMICVAQVLWPDEDGDADVFAKLTCGSARVCTDEPQLMNGGY